MGRVAWQEALHQPRGLSSCRFRGHKDKIVTEELSPNTGSNKSDENSVAIQPCVITFNDSGYGGGAYESLLPIIVTNGHFVRPIRFGGRQFLERP
jgi:hypothetical protein